MAIRTMSRRRLRQQMAEAVALCLSGRLSCAAVAQRLGPPNSSLDKWVRQARIDRVISARLIKGSSPAMKGQSCPSFLM